MNCQQNENRIAELIENDLPLTDKLREHLADCQRCGDFYANQLITHKALSQIGESQSPVSSELHNSILSACFAEQIESADDKNQQSNAPVQSAPDKNVVLKFCDFIWTRRFYTAAACVVFAVVVAVYFGEIHNSTGNPGGGIVNQIPEKNPNPDGQNSISDQHAITPQDRAVAWVITKNPTRLANKALPNVAASFSSGLPDKSDKLVKTGKKAVSFLKVAFGS